MDNKDLLIELGTEELPPKALLTLSRAFSDGFARQLNDHDLGFTEIKSYATPRRLAILVTGLQCKQADSQVEKKGPALKAAFNADGNPSKAAEGFARSVGVTVAELDQKETDKGAWLVYTVNEAGAETSALIPGFIDTALNKLPIPKRMRWGSGKVQFVRPVHWLVVLFGDKVLPCQILSLDSANQTLGHRFHSSGPITLTSPGDYELQLKSQGKVIADYEERKSVIRQQVISLAKTLGGKADINEDLLDEVTGLVELPNALVGKFEEHFLEIPHEALVYAMQEHQKFFPVFDDQNRLMPFFITVSNIISIDPNQVVAGNERVIRPRLADARFFFENDSQSSLEQHNKRLSNVIFQAQLGTVLEKAERIAVIAEFIASQCKGNTRWAHQAGLLCKADLCTDMVGEFASMQGIMASYLAEKENMAEEVALAFKEQYLPGFSGDKIPSTLTGAAISIADKLDSVVGIFGIGQKPSGDKDPYALRRAALGILRIIIEKKFPLDLKKLIALSVSLYGELLDNKSTSDDAYEFIQGRYKARYHEAGIKTDTILSVLELSPPRPLDFEQRIKAVEKFRDLPEAKRLAEANKRVNNILSKAKNWSPAPIDETLLTEPAETQLVASLSSLEQQTQPLFSNAEYEKALFLLASSQKEIDGFFDHVMVMVDDETIKNNRLNILHSIHQLFSQVADISKLQS